MGEARKLMDRVTEAIVAGDWEAFTSCYALDAAVSTPDVGELKGRDELVAYMKPIRTAFADLRWESLHSYEAGNTAIDEGWVCGTHTGDLVAPNGETVPATGKSLRLRECDIVTVEAGAIISHRFYFDQMELLGQLGLMPEG